RFLFMFFFSSRRRHTRWPRDWSSDVCSSDLPDQPGPISSRYNTLTMAWPQISRAAAALLSSALLVCAPLPGQQPAQAGTQGQSRSEERRVGKECRSEKAADHEREEYCGVVSM